MKDTSTKTERKKSRTPAELAISIVCIVLIVILSIILIGNLTIIIKGALNPDAPPSIFGVMPLVALSGSMEGELPGSFGAGSLIVMKKVDTLEIGDVIAFRDPYTVDKLVIVSHRIDDIAVGNDGVTRYITKGDANNAPDGISITRDAIFGEYAFHIEKLGSFALFLREPIGMLLFIGLPILAYIIYDIIRHRIEEQKKEKENQKMQEELIALRASAENAPQAEEAPEKTEALPENDAPQT